MRSAALVFIGLRGACCPRNDAPPAPRTEATRTAPAAAEQAEAPPAPL
jgi:hypothetical protein